jgi:glycosyltransferase involved in cell wall biosynthesis
MARINELIEEGVSGLLFEPGGVTGLAAKLESLLTTPELRQRLAANGRTVIEERFDRRNNFAQLKTWLVQAAGLASVPAGPTEMQLHPAYDANCIR